MALKKKRKPHFKQMNYGRTDMRSVKDTWRKPRGIDNKKRLKLKSAGPIPRIGFRNPREIRGLHPSGFFEVLVHNAAQLALLDAKKTAARIASSVGGLGRIRIEAEAKKLGIKLLN